MKKRISPGLIIAAIISTNVLGFLLNVLELDTFVILLGFRFHLALTIPFLFIIHRLRIEDIKREFIHPRYVKNYPFVISLIVIPLIIYAAAFAAGIIELGDPEYFYEFGISSVLDLPIYLVWNAPQIIMFYFFLHYAGEGRKYSFLFISLTSILLFVFEFINPEPFSYDIWGIACLILSGIAASLLINRLTNVYWFTIYIFLLFWQFILMFGSTSPELIKIIFASQYTAWEGFFIIEKVVREYSLTAFLFVSAVMVLIFSLSERKKKDFHQ